ncbi:MAG: trypsin-like peptidase domain-containing protein [Candidatus Moranbacteria bacterium]|jgi:S1-C subfamily serine protease|nr:trypsin-like peptidase domain-containing protein [Candidatus Moranbacteria bacterium]
MEQMDPLSEKQPEVLVLPSQKHRRGQVLALLVLTLLAGFVGGLVAPRAEQYLGAHVPFLAVSPSVAPSTNQTRVVIEDTVVADLVEQHTPSVVSIVISKDVPKVRNFFGNPFGVPFFSPFGSGGSGQQNSTETEKQKIGSGSGFFVSADGLIITNKHVVADEQAEYTVITQNGTEYSAKVLARDPSNDIAVIKVEGQNFPGVILGDSDHIRVGETIIAIGNPLGEFENSVSRGIVSGLKRTLDAGSSRGDSEHLSGIIQVDAAINPGNSGGPLFNLSGEVIGVNVAMAQGAQNIGFSLPINQVKRIVEQVRSTGKISFPYLGVRAMVLNDAVQKQTKLPFNYGALVLRGDTLTDFAVVPGSPADKAGITENDILLEINGQKIDVDHSLIQILGQHNVGDEITVKVWHKGDTKDIKVKLEERQ